MQPRLPPEIIDCIIDVLVDKPALLICSSVARTWVARSRHHLFCSLHLRLTRSRVLRLKYLIESAHGSGFVAHVNHLHLVYADSAHLVELWHLLSHFTRLQSLSMVPAGQTDAMRLADMPPLIQLPLLTDLRVTKVRFRWYTDLAMVLTRVGACLRVLHLSGSVESVSKYRRKIKPPKITLPNLECLRIAPSGGLLDWLKWNGWALRAPRVELIFGKDDEEAIPSLLWDYFDALGARLTYVVFSFDNERQLGECEQH
ncbi:hypothetical protein MKEN_00992000 [Mycena kentingensis (nom. inval.)]|nr:hypothetical protein MKEN_00992000 [Mycena kentingensis (nom. inval.)]